MTIAYLSAVAGYLPDSEVTSSEIETRVSQHGLRLPAGLIKRLSGVSSRHVAPDSAHPSDLACHAARRALNEARVSPQTVDVVIFAGACQDFAEPATANVVQANLGCHAASAFDVKNACNSFLSAFDIAAAMVESGRARTVLIAAGEILSRLIDYRIQEPGELATKVAALTLGDAGAAAVVSAERCDAVAVLHPGAFQSLGQHWQLSTVLAGGSRGWRGDDTHFFRCESSRLQELGIDALPGLIRYGLGELGWHSDSIDVVIPHQVTEKVIKTICEKVNIDFDKCEVTLDFAGNTAAVSIPLALAQASAAGRLSPGVRGIMVGGAAGLSLGMVAFECI